MEYAPIALFVYNRLWHTQKTINALLSNKLSEESELFIFSDGAKRKEAQENITEVRNYIKTIAKFKQVHIIEREMNLGLAASIIDGVTKIVKQYGRVIVLEDDLVTSPYFLQYMNDALDMYQNEDQVISIHAYCYPVKNELPETFFLKGADCWGWATWDRGWALFNKKGSYLLEQLEKNNLLQRFDYDGCANYLDMLNQQIRGMVDSWAILWYGSALVNNKLTLYPGKSLVRNIGHDGSGRHSRNSTSYDTEASDTQLVLNKIDICEDENAYRIFKQFFIQGKKGVFTTHIISILKRLKLYKVTKIVLSYLRKNSM